MRLRFLENLPLPSQNTRFEPEVWPKIKQLVGNFQAEFEGGVNHLQTEGKALIKVRTRFFLYKKHKYKKQRARKSRFSIVNLKETRALTIESL